MEKSLLQSALYIVIILPFFFVAYYQTKRMNVILVLTIFLIILGDNICLFYLPKLVDLKQTWNWTGKIFELAFSLIFIFLFGEKRISDYGLTFSVAPKSLKPITLTFVAVAVFINGLQYMVDGFKGAKMDTILFQCSMPGLSEELVFRGLLLALANDIFGKRWELWGTTIGWGSVISSVLFGLAHGVVVTKSLHINMDIAALIATGILGFIFAWARERSGSLIPPISGHNLINVLGSF